MTGRTRWLVALVAVALGTAVVVALVTSSRAPERLDDRLPPEHRPDAERTLENDPDSRARREALKTEAEGR